MKLIFLIVSALALAAVNIAALKYVGVFGLFVIAGSETLAKRILVGIRTLE